MLIKCHLIFLYRIKQTVPEFHLSKIAHYFSSLLVIYAYWFLGFQVQTGAGSQSQEHSSSVPAALRNFSMSQKERTLEELVRDRWLHLSSEDKIGLGIRSFLDLRSWFRSNDIPSCEVCNEAAVKVILLFKLSNSVHSFLTLTWHVLDWLDRWITVDHFSRVFGYVHGEVIWEEGQDNSI